MKLNNRWSTLGLGIDDYLRLVLFLCQEAVSYFVTTYQEILLNLFLIAVQTKYRYLLMQGTRQSLQTCIYGNEAEH